MISGGLARVWIQSADSLEEVAELAHPLVADVERLDFDVRSADENDLAALLDGHVGDLGRCETGKIRMQSK